MAETPSPSDSLSLAPLQVPECVAGVRVAISHTFTMDQYDFLVRTASTEKASLGDLLSEILTDAVHDFIQNASNERADHVRMKARLRRTAAAKKDAPVPKEEPKPTVPPPAVASSDHSAPSHPNLTALFDEVSAKGVTPDVLVVEVASRAGVPLPIVKVLYAKHQATKPAAPVIALEVMPTKPRKSVAAERPKPKKKVTPKAKTAPKKKAARLPASKPAPKKAAPALAAKKTPPAAPRPVKRTPRPKKS